MMSANRDVGGMCVAAPGHCGQDQVLVGISGVLVLEKTRV